MPELCAITFSAPKWEDTVNAWREYLGYHVVHTGYLTPELARTWNAPKNADARIALMVPESEDKSVLVRIIENVHPDNYRPLRSFGWSSLELTVSDVDSLASRLATSPFKIIGKPHDLSFSNGAIRAMQVQGPADEIILLTEIKEQIQDFHLPKSRSDVDRPFVAILATRDLDATRDFYYEKLWIPKGRDIETQIWILSNAFFLDRDTCHRISASQLANQGLIEIDEYPEGATRRPVVPGYLVPGVCHVSFAVPEIDDIPLYWLTEPTAFDGPPYEGMRQVTFFGSTGELIELIERT